MIQDIAIVPFDDQKPGTSGLRKTTARFSLPHYLESFVQSLFDTAPSLIGATLVLGGDGRFHNDVAVQTILKMAAANGVSRVIVGQNGLLSTPACSHLIRLSKAQGGLVLSASHNPGGPEGDFGIKFNIDNGGPAPAILTDAIFAQSQTLRAYRILSAPDIDISDIGETRMGEMSVSVIDPVADYADLMETLFDFAAIRALIEGGFTLSIDSMHAVTGPYALEIFERRLGAKPGTVMNAVPLPDFGGGHPDPNPVYAKALFAQMFGEQASDFGAASDGDGDRHIILGRGVFVSPSDSVAVIAANAHLTPAFKNGIVGAARSMPTSGALDVVCKALDVPCYETPTGWKYFGNLLDAGKISICGEESAGSSSDHVREKDGLWAVLMWLNIIAARGMSVADILADHWARFGRHYYARYDYEGLDVSDANKVIEQIGAQLSEIKGKTFGGRAVSYADSFTYTDSVDGVVTQNQGLRIGFEDGGRLAFRLSGTGTVGATLRIYGEVYETEMSKLSGDPHDVLAPLFGTAIQIADLKKLTNRTQPSVIT